MVMIADAGVCGAQRASRKADHASAAAAACNVHRLADMTELVNCQQLEVCLYSCYCSTVTGQVCLPLGCLLGATDAR